MATSCTFEDFFFKATGNRPYPYQKSLAISFAFPPLLDIPTGLGKTAAVTIGWLWRRYIGEGVTDKPAAQVRDETPRRLIYCLPMRVLVEQTKANAGQWVKNLEEAGLIPAGEVPDVSILMGGDINYGWDNWPGREAIIVGTQDQLLSRALNRGYTMSRFRWPVHFGMLNNDCLWVMDEVQLMGPGLPTTVQLQGFREKLGIYGTTGSTWMSATLDKDAFSTIDSPFRAKSLDDLCLQLGDDVENPSVQKHLKAKKPLHKCEIILNKESQRNYEKSLAEEIQKIHERTKGLTIVILNRVRRAQDVAATLSELYKDQEDPPDITLMHSRFRPSERSRFEALLGTLADGKTRNRILVATQVVEAGVDISASTLITELAPWSSLVQRFGRLNRFGEIDGAKAYWVDIEWKWMEESKEKAEPKLALPYEGSELETSKVILNGLADVGPGGLKSVDAPSIVESCPLLRKKDILELFDTTPDLSGSDVDVSQYIRKADNLDVHVFWRRWEGEHPPNDEPTPHPEELCPVLLGEMKDFLKVKDNAAWVWEIFDSLWQRCEIANLRPGLTLLLSTEAGGYDIELGWVGERGKKPVEPVEHKQKSLAEAVGDDPAAETQGYLSILDHSNDIVAELEQIFAEVKLNGLPKEDLVTAARWHDRGKAHPVFQNAIAEDMEKLNRTEWAKAPSMGPYKRRCFRHELASALALLLYGGSNLSAYLVAAHHGKVRLSIRSLPTESIPPGNRRFARGVWDDDLLPAVELGGGVIAPEVTLSLQMMELGKSEEYGPSWLERILKLLGSEGPFRLAYLESLLRVADWRASDVSGKESHGLQ